MEVIIDCRESQLIEKLKEEDLLEFQTRNLELGDLLISSNQSPLLMIERKTVRDLGASLRDGRYHNQRKRWKDFLQTYPECKVAVWVEGNLLQCHDIDETMKSSLVNSLLRLQSIHGILVYQVSSMGHFIQSLKFVVEKFKKDPTHLCIAKESSLGTASVNLKPFKKTTEVLPDMVWKQTLALIPGVSMTTANSILQTFPTLKSLVLDEDAVNKLASIMVGGRRIGQKTASKIIGLLCA